MSSRVLDKLLVLVDGSDASVCAVNFAVRLASELESSLTAVFVVDTATMDYLGQMRILVPEERTEFERDLERTGRRYLDYAVTVGRRGGVAVDTVLQTGRLHKTVLALARTRHADAIVLAGCGESITHRDMTSRERRLIVDSAEGAVIVIRQDPGPSLRGKTAGA